MRKIVKPIFQIRYYLNFLDNGIHKPFFWVYMLISILHLISPILVIITTYSDNSFGEVLPFYIIITYAMWLNFSLWSIRMLELEENNSNDFIATKIFSHFIKTLGESIGLWLIMFSVVGLYLFISFAWSDGMIWHELSFLYQQGEFVLYFISSFFVIIFSRFIAEQINVFSDIANNTKR